MNLSRLFRRAPGRSKSNPGPSAEDIARVLGALADEHASQREAETRRHVWARLTGQPRLVRPRVTTHQAAWSASLRSSVRGWFVGFGLATALAAIAVWFTLSPRTLEFSVDGATADGSAIKTGAQKTLVEFSDSSWMRVQAHSALDVAVVGEHSALTRLWRGELHAKVHHEKSTNWRFLAGPYEVHVIGTEFDLKWDPDASKLSLAMVEGKVKVVQPNGSSRILTRGQSIEWGGDREPEKAQQAASTLTQPEPPAERPQVAGKLVGNKPKARHLAAVARKSAQDLEEAEKSVESEVSAPEKESWTELLAHGEFAQIVDDAQSQGVGNALSGRSASELKALAQAARYTGDSSLARRTWGAIRRRFDGQSQATQAAFFLARIEEGSGNTTSALRLFDAYLKQAPSGVYASEALGRKVALLSRSSNRARVESTAREYLRRFPRGPYAELARSVVNSP